MNQHIFVIIILALFVSGNAKADTKAPKNIPAYCSIVESHILQLYEGQTISNSDMAKYASDQPTANAKKFQDARQSLESFSASLKENEEEWYRLNCAEILYFRSNK